ncbi:MAG: carbon-nitrogen hydrolase family protein [Hyphomonadaceae bacterium]
MKSATVQAHALQFPVTMDVARNVAAIERLLADTAPGALAIAPEGALSGYLPQPGFVSAIDQHASAAAIERMAQLCREKAIHLVAGACIEEAKLWRNASLYFGPRGERHRYDKINLANSERGTFAPGDRLPVFDVEIGGAPVKLGIQMCREIRYPEQWRALAAQGADIIAYVNNAIGSAKGHALWQAHAISRAAETQRFVIGANNAAPDQTCPTLIIAPSGDVLAQAPIGAECAIAATLALDDVSSAVLDQSRSDVVSVNLRS